MEILQFRSLVDNHGTFEEILIRVAYETFCNHIKVTAEALRCNFGQILEGLMSVDASQMSLRDNIIETQFLVARHS